MANSYPIYVGGEWEESASPLEVLSPYSGETVARTFNATPDQLERATSMAVEAFRATRKMSSYDRAEALKAIAQGVEQRKEEIARTIALEGGKPIKDATGEVQRAVFTFSVAAEEAQRIGGEVIPLDLMAASTGRWGFTRRFPVGPVAAITPFNFPINLAAHKVAPAIAAGNPIVLKPASKTPLTMLIVAQIIHEAGLPRGAVSVLPMPRTLGDRLVEEERFKVLTFTGSPEVGWPMKARAGKKKVILELGGNAGVIVDAECDFELAVKRVRAGAFGYAGQSCISVQRVYAHESIYERFREALVESAQQLRLGDPLDRNTDVGPMIDSESSDRVMEWIEEAISRGARVLTGGHRSGNIVEPTVLCDVPAQCRICRLEAFAPIVDVFPFKVFKGAVQEVNHSDYGLQAGVFTQSLENAFYAFDELEVGGVVINDVPTWRIDHMPYGGVKDSGLGREGLRYAIEETTELRLLVLNRG